jgi:hypothetical protein
VGWRRTRSSANGRDAGFPSVNLLKASDNELPKDTGFIDNRIFEDLLTGNVFVPLKPGPSEDSQDLRVCMLVPQTVILGAQNRTVGHDVGIVLYRLENELAIFQKKTKSQSYLIPERQQYGVQGCR